MQLSVIIPVFNCATYLGTCLDSLKKQTFKDFEIIVVDDGSKDESKEIADESLRNFNHSLVLKQENKGVSAARNAGLRIASGKFIVFVDGDDYLSADYLETLIMSAGNHDWVLSGMIDFYNDGRDNICSFDNDSMVLDDEVTFWRFLGTPLLTSACSKLYRKDIIQSNHLSFNERMRTAEDRDFNLQYLRHAHSVRLMKYAGYFYRRDISNSLSKSIDENKFKDSIIYWKSLKDVCDNKRFYGKITRCRLSNILYYLTNDEIAFVAKNSRNLNFFLKILNRELSLVNNGYLLKSFFLIIAPFWQKFLVLSRMYKVLFYVYKAH